MRYPFRCVNSHHLSKKRDFEIDAPMEEGPPSLVSCPFCGSCEVERTFVPPPVHYNASGFSKDYFSRSPGRGQSWDKKENLNENWSKHYGEEPPPPDSHGTYDGTPRR